MFERALGVTELPEWLVQREDRGRTPASRGGRDGTCAVAGLRRAAPLARDLVQLPPGARAPQQGPPLPAGPAQRGGIIAVMRACGRRLEGVRLRAVIVVLWRAGLRISEALALSESDLDRRRGAVLVGMGKAASVARSGYRWAWVRTPWLEHRAGLPTGALFCVVRGPDLGPAGACLWVRAGSPTCGRPCGPAGMVPSCTAPPRRPGSDDGSRRTTSDMRTRSMSAKGSPAASRSRRHSGMPTSPSPARICVGSTTPDRSTRCMNAPSR